MVTAKKQSNKFVTSCLGLGLAFFFSATPVHAEDGHERQKKNHASVFLGGTNIPDADHTAFTLGIDLEHELTHRFGVGLVFEHAFDPIDATSLYAVLDIHLGNGFVLQTGPGVEWVDDETYATGRVGLFYEFEVQEGLILAPSVSYDISEAEDSIVFGVSVGTKF